MNRGMSVKSRGLSKVAVEMEDGAPRFLVPPCSTSLLVCVFLCLPLTGTRKPAISLTAVGWRQRYPCSKSDRDNQRDFRSKYQTT